jgi:hypothetical protein
MWPSLFLAMSSTASNTPGMEHEASEAEYTIISCRGRGGGGSRLGRVLPSDAGRPRPTCGVGRELPCSRQATLGGKARERQPPGQASPRPTWGVVS